MNSSLGHNNPPEVIEAASGVISDISSWMADHPVVETADAAREMKLYVDRAKLCIKDLEDERNGKVRPLNEEVHSINASYKGPRRMLDSLLEEMLGRIQKFVIAEEDRRKTIAAEAARVAKEAEERARAAELAEKERLDNIAQGEIGIDVAAVISEADEAFDDYIVAEREAIRAQKETHVKISGGLSRAIGMKEREILEVEQPFVAILMIGITDDIKEAILKSARAWRKINGKLPDGIIARVEKRL